MIIAGKSKEEFKRLKRGEDEYDRLVSFVEFPKHSILAVTYLSKLGFSFDPTSCEIICCECDFSYTDLGQLFSITIILEHVRFSLGRCRYLKRQIEFVEKSVQDLKSLQPVAEIVHRPSERSLEMNDVDRREKTFQKFKLKLFPKDLAENGLYVHPDYRFEKQINNNAAIKQFEVNCCYCSYKCTLFEKSALNSRSMSPCVEHKQKHPNCFVFKDASRTEEAQVVVSRSEKMRQVLNKLEKNELTDLLRLMIGTYDNAVEDILGSVFGCRIDELETQYEHASRRLETFANFKKLHFDVIELAEKGFYVQEEKTEPEGALVIGCYYCKYSCVIYQGYFLNNHFKSPLKEHFEMHPDCCTFNKSKAQSTVLKAPQSIDQLPIQAFHYNGDFEQLKSVLSKTASSTSDTPYNRLYTTEQSRLDSFREWPANIAQRPSEMVKAGFYYYGVKDMTKCFFCNGGLRNWDQHDDPLVEHARWFPKCAYVRLLKGSDFIEEVRHKYQDMDSGFTDDFDDSTSQYYDLGEGTESNNKEVRSGGAKIRSISPRTLNARLDLPCVRKVIKDLKIKRSAVKTAIEKKMLADGRDFENATELVRACMDNEEFSKKLHKQVKANFHLYLSNLPHEVTDQNVEKLFKSKFRVTPAAIQRFSSKNSNKSEDIVLIALKPDDLSFVDSIEKELNDKKFPATSSENKILVKKIMQKNNNVEIKNNDLIVNDEKSLSLTPKETSEKDLLKEVEKLKNERRCVACLDRNKNIIFMPCAHLSACVECSVSMKHCPVCRTNVLATIRAYS